MRWGEHWRISRDTYFPQKSLAFQLGSILPDWFERHPIHRWVDTKELFLDRVCRIADMKKCVRRDWYLGTVAHYICDYCCMAHNEEYYSLYKHRVYEVLSQKYDKKKRKRGTPQIKKWMNAVDCGFMYTDDSESDLKARICYAVEQCIAKLHGEIRALNSTEWFRDARIMKLDIEYSYALLKTVLNILNPETK